MPALNGFQRCVSKRWSGQNRIPTLARVNQPLIAPMSPQFIHLRLHTEYAWVDAWLFATATQPPSQAKRQKACLSACNDRIKPASAMNRRVLVQTGHTLGVTGHALGVTGHALDATSHATGAAGHALGVTGQTLDATSHVTVATGHALDVTSHATGAAGHALGCSGSHAPAWERLPRRSSAASLIAGAVKTEFPRWPA